MIENMNEFNLEGRNGANDLHFITYIVKEAKVGKEIAKERLVGVCWGFCVFLVANPASQRTAAAGAWCGQCGARGACCSRRWVCARRSCTRCSRRRRRPPRPPPVAAAARCRPPPAGVRAAPAAAAVASAAACLDTQETHSTG